MKGFTPNDVYLRWLCYAEPGCGKSTLMATFEDDPRTSPCLWVNCGGNPESLRLRKQLPTIITLDTISDMNPIYDWLLKGQPTIHSLVKTAEQVGIPLLRYSAEQTLADGTKVTAPEPLKYKSFVFDGFTGLQRLEISIATGNVNLGPGDPLSAVSERNWGTVLQRAIHVTSKFYELPMHVAFTCLEDDKVDTDSGATRFGPLLLGQARKEVPGAALLLTRLVRPVQLIAAERAQYKGAFNVAIAVPQGPWPGKEQYHMSKTTFMDPTAAQILDAIHKVE